MKTGSGGLAAIALALCGSQVLAQPAAPGADVPLIDQKADQKARPATRALIDQNAAPPGGPPTPAPQLQQLKFFAGTWTCDGKGFASPFAPAEHPIKATAKVKWDLNNFWQTFVYEEKKTKEHPHPAKVAGTWGWDSGGKRFVRADADTMGGWFSPTSTGWAGEQFVWVGDLSISAGMLPARHTFTKTGDKGFVHAFALNVNGVNTPIFEVTCKK